MLQSMFYTIYIYQKKWYIVKDKLTNKEKQNGYYTKIFSL